MVSDLEAVCSQIKDARQVEADIKNVLKEHQEKLSSLESKALEMLNELDKDSYRSNSGTIYRSSRVTWLVPKMPEERLAFFGYLREQGVFEQMITVHSQTLNSYCKVEAEKAKERGEVLEIPGLGTPSIQENIGFRKT